MVPPFLNDAFQHNSTHAVIQSLKTAPPVNGEALRSAYSLALSGGFDAYPSAGLHPPGSLLDYPGVYWS